MTQNVDGKRVVMRQRIAENLAAFRAAPDDFEPRPVHDEPDLQDAHIPFFSLIVPNYNGQHYLSALFRALERQTFTDFECIVVDDASTDESLSVIESWSLSFRIVSNSQNLGFAVSCNNGAAAANGKYIVLLNSDTEPEPGWLAELASGICTDPYAGMYASKVLLMQPRGHLHTTGDTMGRDGVPNSRGVWEADKDQYDATTDVFSASGCAAAYDRRLWEALGGLDESFWMYLEDVDFAFRARLMGARAVYVPSARVLHQLTATASGSLNSYYVGRNTIWLIAKDMPTALIKKNWASILWRQMSIAADALQNVCGSAARARLKGQLIGLLTLPENDGQTPNHPDASHCIRSTD